MEMKILSRKGRGIAVDFKLINMNNGVNNYLKNNGSS